MRERGDVCKNKCSLGSPCFEEADLGEVASRQAGLLPPTHSHSSAPTPHHPNQSTKAKRAAGVVAQFLPHSHLPPPIPTPHPPSPTAPTDQQQLEKKRAVIASKNAIKIDFDGFLLEPSCWSLVTLFWFPEAIALGTRLMGLYRDFRETTKITVKAYSGIKLVFTPKVRNSIAWCFHNVSRNLVEGEA